MPVQDASPIDRAPHPSIGRAGGQRVGIVGFLVLGLLAGALAKTVLQRAAGGWVATLFLGVVGAIAAGFLGSMLLRVDLGSFFDARTWALAIGGSIAVLIAFRMLTGRRG
jgi:uncharacterized membrane protein YeaQ/YmgE (transglycosylase-associated protein family)